MQIVRKILITSIAFALSACNLLPQRNEIPADTAPATAEQHVNLSEPEQISTAPDLATVVPQEEELTQQVAEEQEVTGSVVDAQGTTDHQEIIEPYSDETSYSDVWIRIGENLAFPRHTDHPGVKAKLSWYSRNQAYLDRVAERARPYIFYIVEELERRNMPMELALLPIVESAYHPFAYSPSRASGIWQFISSTGKHYGLKQDWWYDGRRDITAATDAALDYLENLHQRFEGDWLLALAAYNSGERNVERAIKRNKKAGKKGDFWSLRLPRETRFYVPSLLAIAELVANPNSYQVNLQPIPNEPYFSKVDVGNQLDLAMVAKLADLSMEEVYTLNPGFNRWATAPDGPHTLLIPVEKQDNFVDGLANLPEDERINWKRHVIKEGESLSEIAERHHTSITTIKQTNGLRGNLIRAGRSLLIPTSKQPLKQYSLSLDARRFRGLKKMGTGNKYIYKVRKGDNLWDIGNQYGVSVKQLCAWNGISRRGILRLGQKLTMWLSDSGEAVAGKHKAVPMETETIQVKLEQVDANTLKYTVREGDSLWLISRRFGTSVAQLKKWNNLTKGRYLRPGQQLILYKEEIQISGA